MNTVHIFVSSGRFRSFAEMRTFVEPSYTADGERVPSAFMREVSPFNYEPACIECLHALAAVPITELLADATYSEQWINNLPREVVADAAICVFSPNRIEDPAASTLEYLGSFVYQQ